MSDAAVILGGAREALEDGQKLALLSVTQKMILIPKQDRSLLPTEIPTKEAAIARLVAARSIIDEAIGRLR